MTRIRHLVRNDDEGYAFMSVILLMLVVSMFSILLLGVVFAQVTPTLLSAKNSRTLVAAQAGIDAAVGQFRNATSPDSTGTDMGDIHKLPCEVVGTVDGTGGETHYKVKVQYFTDDPAGHDGEWREDNALTCYTGTGPNGGLRAVPHFALMSSEGFDDTATASVTSSRADRVIEATYTFELTTIKVSGGLILDKDSAFCLVAESATANKNIVYKPASSADCATPSDVNTWSWRSDYMIHLTSTDASGKTSLCITGRPNTNGSAKALILKACYTGSNTDPDGQRWAWTGDYTWRGQNAANNAAVNSFIVNQDETVDDGDKLSVASSAAWRSLTPTGAVGKGNASKATDQVVNQNLFGRCLDVTNTVITYSYMIAYPCKQDPANNGNFDWNHKWYYTEYNEYSEYVTTQVQVKTNSKTYCLITTSSTGLKGSPYYAGYSKSFPRFVKDDGNLDCSSATTKWKRYGFSYDVTKAYTFQDSNGKCLSARGPKITEDGGAGTWTSIIVEECDGSDDQKWNVPDSPVGASIGDFEEVTGRAGT